MLMGFAEMLVGKRQLHGIRLLHPEHLSRMMALR
jgi:hypothetical protein